MEKGSDLQEENVDENLSNPKVRSVPEISIEDAEKRRLLAALLLDQTNELTKERHERQLRIARERIDLRSGASISRQGITDFVIGLRQDYDSAFPNSNPFFKNIFRLHPALVGQDPDSYIKHPLCGKLLKHLTYDRFKIEFSSDVLPELRVFAMPDGIRVDKFYKYLTPKGFACLKEFRDQANSLMSNFDNLQWYRFNLEYCRKHKLVCQINIFDDL
jgi:hypothetical protein